MAATHDLYLAGFAQNTSSCFRLIAQTHADVSAPHGVTAPISKATPKLCAPALDTATATTLTPDAKPLQSALRGRRPYYTPSSRTDQRYLLARTSAAILLGLPTAAAIVCLRARPVSRQTSTSTQSEGKPVAAAPRGRR